MISPRYVREGFQPVAKRWAQMMWDRIIILGRVWRDAAYRG